MSHMTCCDCLIGLQMFHGSRIHFRVCVRVHMVSRDMVECGMT